jgi:hypothetical protein
MQGYPCREAAYCLLYKHLAEGWRPDLVNGGDIVLSTTNPIFYSPVYHVDTLIKQYTIPIDIPDQDRYSSSQYQLWPPIIQAQKGRTKGGKSRMKVKRKGGVEPLGAAADEAIDEVPAANPGCLLNLPAFHAAIGAGAPGQDSAGLLETVRQQQLPTKKCASSGS